MNTQFNVENKWYLFVDEIRSVSGDLAIINNVDISGSVTSSNLEVGETITTSYINSDNSISYPNRFTIRSGNSGARL